MIHDTHMAFVCKYEIDYNNGIVDYNGIAIYFIWLMTLDAPLILDDIAYFIVMKC